MRKKITDPTVQMVMDIYALNVPGKSEIANPFTANKRARRSSLSTKQQTISNNVEDWSCKDFVDYFADNYKKTIGGVYKKTYVSDCSFVNEIIEFMDANELDKNNWTKTYLDWCFQNKDYILSKSGTFILNNLKNHLNTFYQQVIAQEKTSAPVIDIFDELVYKVNNGKTKEILSIYGIPIVATYFINHKNITTENIISGLNQLFENLSKGNSEEINLLTKIVQRSINRSPYPESFYLTNWRMEFPYLMNKYKNEAWWRDNDYTGNSQFKYDRLLNN